MQQPQDNTLVFRVNAQEHQLQTALDQIKELREQIKTLVGKEENKLQIQIVHDTVQRIEQDVKEVRNDLKDMKVQIVQQESNIQKRQDSTQIKTLAWIVGSIFTGVILIIVGYITHLFH